MKKVILTITLLGSVTLLGYTALMHPIHAGDGFTTAAARDAAGHVAESAIAGEDLGAATEVNYQKENLAPHLANQFLLLQHHGEALAFRRGVGDKPESCRHYQGLARSTGYGVPYFFLTRNGSGEGVCTTDYPGELLVVRMESRNQLGKRFGSNRLHKDRNLEDFAPPANDRGIKSFHFGIDNNWPRYTHIGGIQLIDDVLVVAVEKLCPLEYPTTDPDPAKNSCPVNIQKRGGIALIDVGDPEDPQLITSKEFFTTDDGHGVGLVGATYIKPGEQTEFGGQYLFALAWGTSDKLRFAVAETDDLHTATEANIRLLPGAWSEDNLGGDKAKWRDWQTLQFFRDEQGQLYLLGADNVGVAGGKDYIGLFRFDPAGLTSGGGLPEIEFIGERHLRLGEPDMGVLDAASSFYVSPTGQLIFYSAPHTDRNTWDEDNQLVKSVEMGEFRNIHVSFEGTCGATVARRSPLVPPWRSISSSGRRAIDCRREIVFHRTVGAHVRGHACLGRQFAR